MPATGDKLQDANWTGQLELKLVILVVVTYVGMNIGLNYYDNWILTPEPDGLGLPAPLFYSFLHMFATFIGTSGFVFGLDAKTDFPHKPTFMQFWNRGYLFVLNAGFFCCNIVVNNQVVASTSPSVNSAFRAAVVWPVLAGSWFWEKRRYSLPKVAIIFLFPFTALIALPFESYYTDTKGALLSILACICIGGKTVVSSRLLHNAHATGLFPMVLVWYDSMLGTIFMFFSFLLAGETFKLNQIRTSQPFVLFFGAAAGAFASVPYNYISFKLIQVTSSSMHAICSGVIKLYCVVVIPMIIIDRTTWWGAYVGLVTLLILLGLYGYAEQKYEMKHMQWIHADEKRWKAAEHGGSVEAKDGAWHDPDKIAKEKTPLTAKQRREQRGMMDPSISKSWFAF